ncbi:MAG: T9SS type A sorting domain-containing protein, partial [Bacteroidetes bacterium]|nr:T9SS type A sorting domain-containing protein [Bacteroidota bacterium]
NYIIFHSNAVKGDSTAYFRVDSVLLGVADDKKHDDFIDLYPNPADDFLLINIKDDVRKPDFVRLFDYYGNVVYENKNFIDENLKIRTSELASGMYFLQIGSVGLRKVLVVH